MFAAALVLAATLSIEDYLTINQLATPRLSPDGSRIAYVVTRADLQRNAWDSDVWLVSSDGNGGRQLTRTDSMETNPRWSPDGSSIAFLSDRQGGSTSIWLIDPDGGEARRLTREPTAIREYAWSPDGKTIAFVRLDERSVEEERRTTEREDMRVVGEGMRPAHLHLLDLTEGTVKRLTGGSWSVRNGISWSPDGKTIAFDRAPGEGLDDLYRTDVYTVDVASGSVRPLVVRPGADRGPVFSPDGKWIAFTSMGVHDWLLEQEIHVVSLAGDAPRKISGAYDRTPDELAWSDDSQSIWFEGPWNTTTQLFRVNVDGSGFTNVSNVEGLATNPHVRGERAVWVFQSPTEPAEIYVHDLGSPKGKKRGTTARRLTNHNEAWRNRTLGETRLISWKNPKDGLLIEALLTLPVGYTPGTRVPLLTFIHGGPASRFEQGFIGYHGATYPPHVLAAKGFAVLRPNPRGTGGYGSAFRVANRNDWALMPWLDIEAGIDQLIADGIADPDRLGLMGWSYGGYLASWVLGHSNRFRAYSIGAPVTDLLSFHGTADIRDFLPDYFNRRNDGDAPQVEGIRREPLSLDLLRSQSPVWHLKPTKARVLIQHGEADDRVPLSQGTLLYRLLDEMDADVTMVVYPRSGHAIREPRLKLDVMRRNVELFETHVKARSASAGFGSNGGVNLEQSPSTDTLSFRPLPIAPAHH